MNFVELYRTEMLPVFQNKMFTNEREAISCSKGDVILVQDMETGLIFNSAYDPKLLLYDSDYQNEQACSSVFKGHLRDVKNIIDRYLAGKALLEVGCGKGYFLKFLAEEGYEIVGLDPAYEGNDPSIIKAPFEAGLGLSGDGVILRHVLEHIPNPVDFISSIGAANGGNGLIYIEVPCFDWICKHSAWFDIFYEHVNYFRASDFQRIFSNVIDIGHLFGGQYLYVVADISSLRKPHLSSNDHFKFPINFTAKIKSLANITRQKQNAVWGGASKGVLFVLNILRNGGKVDSVIDINPAKQGKHLPASGMRVLAPDEAFRGLTPGDNIFVMNSNYLDEVVALSGNKFNYIKVD